MVCLQNKTTGAQFIYFTHCGCLHHKHTFITRSTYSLNIFYSYLYFHLILKNLATEMDHVLYHMPHRHLVIAVELDDSIFTIPSCAIILTGINICLIYWHFSWHCIKQLPEPLFTFHQWGPVTITCGQVLNHSKFENGLANTQNWWYSVWEFRFSSPLQCYAPWICRLISCVLVYITPL